jgi:hypothetical protein
VRSDAKASSAGSTKGQGAGPNSSLCAAGGTDGARGHSSRQRLVALVLSGILAVGLVVAVSVASGAAPTVTVENASGVEYTTATAKGHVDPSTHETSYHFQYATEPDFSNAESAGFGSVAEGSGPTPVEAELIGLRPATTYHLRLVGDNEEGTASAEAAGTFTTKAVAAPTVSIEPVTIVGATTAALSGEIDPNAPGPAPQNPAFDTHWRFVCTPECPGVSGEVLADNAGHAVSAEATGLEPNTAYKVNLVAENTGGTGEAGPESFGTGEAAPAIVSASTRSVELREVSLVAMVDTANAETTYHFEYGPTAGYGSATPESLPLLSPPRRQRASATIEGLEPGTTYHWRIVATNPTGTIDGPDRVFATFPEPVQGAGCSNEPLRYGLGAQLPDCRAYEQATPLNKLGGNASGGAYLLKASPAGNAITYFLTGGGEGGEGGQQFPTFVATRGSGNWSSSGLYPPTSLGTNIVTQAWAEDPSLSYTTSFNLRQAGTLYLRDSPARTQQTIASGLKPVESGSYVGGESVGGGEVLLQSTQKLTPGATQGVPNLYVWDKGTGALKLASIAENDEPIATGAFAGPYSYAAFGGSLEEGAVEEAFYMQNMHVMSQDGGSVFFSTSGEGQIYVRDNLDTPTPSTVHVSAPHRTSGTDPLGPQPAQFLEATPSGEDAFFTSGEKLTEDAETGAADEGSDLYRYSVGADELIDLTPEGPGPNGAEVIGFLGSSANGAYAYFVANGALAPGASPGDCQVGNFVGECTLYLWHEGTLTTIARLSGKQGEGGGENWTPSGEYGGNVYPEKLGRVASDGSSVVFASSQSPTSYNSKGNSEFYRYSPAEGLKCLSCNPTGVDPLGSASMQDIEPGFIKPFQTNIPALNRYVSSDGDRVFFETPERLSPNDTNSSPDCEKEQNQNYLKCQDVYEWESDGTGSCHSADEAGGCLYLISPGNSAEPAFFADASANGNDVFFFTNRQLVGQDRDELLDVYDASVEGGLPEQNPSPSPGCQGEQACAGSAAAAPTVTSPGTATFAGPGNAKPKHHKAKHKRHKPRRHKSKAKHQKANHRRPGSHR